MKCLLLLTTTLVLTSLTSFSQEAYSEYFSGEGGFRIDYSKAAPTGESQKDNVSSIVHIQIGKGDDTATINLITLESGKIKLVDAFQGLILKRTPSMIYMLADHTQGEKSEKLEAYVIFPKEGTGFLLTASSYLGMPIGKLAATENDEFPYGSGLLLRLKKMEL